MDNIDNYIEKFSVQFEYTINSGMILEINMFLGESEMIKHFDLRYSKNKYVYLIDVLILEEFTYAKAKKLFKDFISYVEYHDMTLYSSKQYEKSIHYTVYTVMSSGRGAHFEINIK